MPSTLPSGHSVAMAAARWFLDPDELGRRPAAPSGRDAWSTGDVLPLIDGAAYFARLRHRLADLRAGDEIFFADWRSDADERLTATGPTLAEVLCDLAARGVAVRGLIWRSHSDRLRLNAQANERLATRVNQAGGEVLLDQRIPWFGSHHQKLFVIRHRDDPDRDVAFVGGLDLCHGRRDDSRHRGDPQPAPMDARYTDHAPWHDLVLELRGPIVDRVLATFTERWNDPAPLDGYTPYRRLLRYRAGLPRHPTPVSLPAPARVDGSHAVQMLRTYGRKHPVYPFAPDGEQSIARAYRKAFAQARRMIYIEDQFLWSREVVQGIARALTRSPELRVIIVLPRFPDDNRWFKGPPHRIGQIQAVSLLREAAPDRVAIYDLENENGVPIYVHAKVCIVDDAWFTCGSSNLNRRSWTTDSELTCAVIGAERDEREPVDPAGTGDGARRIARDLRLRLWSEHLGRAVDDPALLDFGPAFALWQRNAATLDWWHRHGRPGSRPPGRVRRHDPDPVSRLTRIWAEPVRRIVFDPDRRGTLVPGRGRPAAMGWKYQQPKEVDNGTELTAGTPRPGAAPVRLAGNRVPVLPTDAHPGA